MGDMLIHFACFLIATYYILYLFIIAKLTKLGSTDRIESSDRSETSNPILIWMRSAKSFSCEDVLSNFLCKLAN